MRDVVESKQVQIEKIHTGHNGSDMMTETLPKDKLNNFRERAGLEFSPKIVESERFVG